VASGLIVAVPPKVLMRRFKKKIKEVRYGREKPTRGIEGSPTQYQASGHEKADINTL
jgi:hypothetical protein